MTQRPKRGVLALTQEQHEWLIKAVGGGIVTRLEAAVKLGITPQSVENWLKRPIGYVAKNKRAADSDTVAAERRTGDDAIGGYHA
jgi:predicted transcriptional regulator